MTLKDYVAASFFAKPEKRLNPLAAKTINPFERKNMECFHFNGIGQLAT
jgi:hypothetical protein